MIEERLGILCMTETYKPGVEAYIIDEGFLAILSGGISGVRERVGVGFLVSLLARRYVIGFTEFSD